MLFCHTKGQFIKPNATQCIGLFGVLTFSARLPRYFTASRRCAGYSGTADLGEGAKPLTSMAHSLPRPRRKYRSLPNTGGLATATVGFPAHCEPLRLTECKPPKTPGLGGESNLLTRPLMSDFYERMRGRRPLKSPGPALLRLLTAC